MIFLYFRKLANETANAVQNIQTTISEVQTAFEHLECNASDLLKFVSDTVTPDYKNFVEVASQYGQDAATINSISVTASRMSDDIRQIMNEVTTAIQNIAESTQNTAHISSEIVTSIDDVSEVVHKVSDMAKDQSEISEELTSVVNGFKL